METIGQPCLRHHCAHHWLVYSQFGPKLARSMQHRCLSLICSPKTHGECSIIIIKTDLTIGLTAPHVAKITSAGLIWISGLVPPEA